MTRVNPWDDQYPEKPLPSLTRPLSAPGCPDLILTLQALDELGTGVALDKLEAYEEKYLGAAPKPLTLPGGRSPKLSRSILRNVATLEAMQVPEDGEEPYSLSDWLGFMIKFRPLWRQILKLSDEVQALYREQEAGNDSGAATATSS